MNAHPSDRSKISKETVTIAQESTLCADQSSKVRVYGLGARLEPSHS